MQDAPYVPSSRLEKVPPSTGAYLTWWAMDAVVAGFVFVGTLLCAAFVLSAWALHPGDGELFARLDTWAVWLAVGVGYVAAVAVLSVGKDHRSPGQNLAEVRTDDMAGRPARLGRRALRAALVLALLLGLAAVHWLLAVAGVLALLAVGLLTPQRRGLCTRLAGLRDYQTDLVQVRQGRTSPLR